MRKSTVQDALGGAIDALEAAGVEDPRLDAEVLLAEATGWDRSRLVAEPEAGLESTAARAFGSMVRRRIKREPVAYILGRKGFRHIELTVDKSVLIPRPETELLVEVALEVLSDQSPHSRSLDDARDDISAELSSRVQSRDLEPAMVLDVGTGSGAVALAVADELPNARVIATDTSPIALVLARANAARLGLTGRVDVRPGTIPAGERFDLALANLPYVREDEWPDLAPEITRHEPSEALLAGPDGLDAIRSFVPAAAAAGIPVVALEVGAGQAPAVSDLLRQAGYGTVEARRDLGGVERVVVGRDKR